VKQACIGLTLYVATMALIVLFAARSNGAWPDIDTDAEVTRFVNSERARFDVWAVGMGMDTTVGELGAYSDIDTYRAWVGWSGRAWAEWKANP